MSAPAAAVYRVCAEAGCLTIADTWLARGLSLDEVKERCAAVERIRLEFPQLAGDDWDSVVLLFARDLPPELARVQAGHMATRVLDIRERAQRQQEEDT